MTRRPIPSRARSWILLALLTAGLVPAPVLANGSGDLYVAVRQGIAEVDVAARDVVNVVSLRPVPAWLAFAPDGVRLYGADGSSRLTVVDIPTISVGGSLPLPGSGVAVAASRDGLLAVALADRREIRFIDPGGSADRWSAALPEPPDVLVADRRVPDVVALRRDGRWVAVVAPAGTVRSAQPGGRIVAAAVEPDGGGLLVATEAPDAVARLVLPGLATGWRVSLPAVPRAVVVVRTAAGGPGAASGAGAAPSSLAAGSFRALAAVGDALWLVGPGGARRWASVGGPVLALAASDGGTVAYAATPDRILALPTDGRPAVALDLAPAPGGGILAPVPRPGSLEANGSTAPRRTSQATGQPPVTSTAAPGSAPARPGAVLALLAGAIFLVSFAAARVLLRLLQLRGGRNSGSLAG